MRHLCMIALLCAALGASADATEDTLRVGSFGKVHLYYNAARVSQVVLFVSGDGGWNLGVVSMARTLASLDAVVVGIDIARYLGALARSTDACSYPAADFEMLSKTVQKKLGFAAYKTPILVGYSSGATLVYGILVQAPAGTFGGAISMGFCPDLPLTKPLCKGSGLVSEPMPKNKGYNLMPTPAVSAPWIMFQGEADQVCDASFSRKYAEATRGARVDSLPKVGHGFSVEKNWLPQFKQAFTEIVSQNAANQPPPLSAEVSDLPLVEVAATGKATDLFAVLLTGDGGWAGIDREIAASLSAAGIPVVGLNTLQYLWTKRTPEEASAALDRIVRHYSSAWNKQGTVLVGYSLGADMAPFMAGRLPKPTLDRVRLIAMLGLSPTVEFQFHVGEWLGAGPGKDGLPVVPEIAKLSGRSMLYFYGSEETETLKDRLDTSVVRKIELPGGHHFNGRYDLIASGILAEISAPKGSAK